MYQYYINAVIFSLYFFSQEILAENCGEDTYCHAPYTCCELKQGCCYDQVIHTNRHLRLQIWNLWYFWFLIIFMMMSCFGGCGYYRRRRLAILTRSSSNDNRPLTIMPSTHRVFRGQPMRGRDFTLLSYENSGVNSMPVSYLPPSYAEIVSHPDVYPATKIDLPPYSASEKPNEGLSNDQGRINCHESDLSLPPPYSACSLPVEMSPPVMNTNLPKDTQHSNAEDPQNQFHNNNNHNNNNNNSH